MAPSQPVYSGPEEFQLSCCLNESKGFRGQLSRSLSERGLRNSWTRIPPPPCFLCGPPSFQFSRYSTCKTRRGLRGERGKKRQSKGPCVKAGAFRHKPRNPLCRICWWQRVPASRFFCAYPPRSPEHKKGREGFPVALWDLRVSPRGEGRQDFPRFRLILLIRRSAVPLFTQLTKGQIAVGRPPFAPV